jgi:hypothetical protein
MLKATGGMAEGKSKTFLSGREQLVLAAIKAVYEKDFDSLMKFLRCIDEDELRKAVQELFYSNPERKVDGFLEKFLLNTARVTYLGNGRKSFALKGSRELVNRVINFYYKNTADTRTRAKIEKVVKRKRHAIHMRLRRMSDDQLKSVLKPDQFVSGDSDAISDD